MSIDDLKKPVEQTTTKPRCCLGVLYFSQSRFDLEKPPVCAGFAKKLNIKDDENAQIITDSIPGGDFRYICMGYSAYDADALKAAARTRKSDTDPIKLPYCEGLEVVSAAAIQSKPELLTSGPNVSTTPRSPRPSSSQDGDEGATIQPRPGRSFVPGGEHGLPNHMDFDQFKERFDRMSKKIIVKMKANADFMVVSWKRAIDQVYKQIQQSSDGGGEKNKD